ncbi:MAG TPA: hypothetical protein VIG34_02170 [Xanthobacteraceae bacterium]|jgi:endonuclease YncB( thermonuclease family)
MNHAISRRALGAAVLALVLVAAAPAFAQQLPAQPPAQPPVRVRGTIEKVDGDVLTVKNRAGETLTIKLADNARVLGMVKVSLDDIKPGAYVGISALPQPDGSQRALHVHFFPETMRGVAEGFGPWDAQPTSTMTNATVAEVTSVSDGRTLLVKYKGEEKKIVVPANTPIVNYVPGDKAELKPGAHIFIIAARRQPDGTLAAAGVSVGRDGLVPPM